MTQGAEVEVAREGMARSEGEYLHFFQNPRGFLLVLNRKHSGQLWKNNLERVGARLGTLEFQGEVSDIICLTVGRLVGS